MTIRYRNRHHDHHRSDRYDVMTMCVLENILPTDTTAGGGTIEGTAGMILGRGGAKMMKEGKESGGSRRAEASSRPIGPLPYMAGKRKTMRKIKESSRNLPIGCQEETDRSHRQSLQSLQRWKFSRSWHKTRQKTMRRTSNLRSLRGALQGKRLVRVRY